LKEFETVYVPGVHVVKSAIPVTGSTVNPDGEQANVPAAPPPLNVGDGFEALAQYGLPV
jgi:hypothetical protein